MHDKRISLMAILIALIWGITGGTEIVRADRVTELEVDGLRRKIVDWENDINNRNVYIISVPERFTPPNYFNNYFSRVKEIEVNGQKRRFWIVSKSRYDDFVNDPKTDNRTKSQYSDAKQPEKVNRNKDAIRAGYSGINSQIAALERKLDQQDLLGLRNLPKIRGKSMPQSVDGLVSFIEELRKIWINSCTSKRDAFKQQAKRSKDAKNDQQAAFYDKKAGDIHFILTDKINGDAARLHYFAKVNVRDPDKLKLVWKTIKCYDDAYGGCIPETIHPGINKCNKDFGDACKELDSQRR